MNLVIGHPRIQAIDEAALPAALSRGLAAFRIEAIERERVPDPIRVVELPFAGDRKLLALYLTPHPAVDAAIRDGSLVVRSFTR